MIPWTTRVHSLPWQNKDYIFQHGILGSLWFNFQMTFQPQLSSLSQTLATPPPPFSLQFPQSFAPIHSVPRHRQCLLSGMPLNLPFFFLSISLKFSPVKPSMTLRPCSKVWCAPLNPGFWLPVTTQGRGLLVHSGQWIKMPRGEAEEVKVWS